MLKHRCPTLFEPMQAGDGLLVRIKPPGGLLTADAARLVARHAPGRIELTSRANIQLRGLRPQDAGLCAAAMLAAGLAVADPAVERRRNVMVAPLADAEARARALDIEAMLVDPAFATLPDKFGFAVDGGAAPALGDVGVDVTLRHGDGGWQVAVGAVQTAGDAAAAGRLARTFLALRQPGMRRMRDLVTATGAEAVFRHAGLAAPSVAPARPNTAPCPGFDPAGWFGLALPLGAMTAQDLRSLADLAEHHGDGTLRLTPWRMIILPGVAADAAPRLGTATDLITDPDDPRLSVIACAGLDCAAATVDARADAAMLARVKPAGLLHVSGCAKGCAHAGPAALALVGRDGRYDLVRHGRAGDVPALLGLAPHELAAALA